LKLPGTSSVASLNISSDNRSKTNKDSSNNKNQNNNNNHNYYQIKQDQHHKKLSTGSLETRSSSSFSRKFNNSFRNLISQKDHHHRNLNNTGKPSVIPESTKLSTNNLDEDKRLVSREELDEKMVDQSRKNNALTMSTSSLKVSNSLKRNQLNISSRNHYQFSKSSNTTNDNNSSAKINAISPDPLISIPATSVSMGSFTISNKQLHQQQQQLQQHQQTIEDDKKNEKEEDQVSEANSSVLPKNNFLEKLKATGNDNNNQIVRNSLTVQQQQKN
jgi:hypothetical protein